MWDLPPDNGILFWLRHTHSRAELILTLTISSRRLLVAALCVDSVLGNRICGHVVISEG